LWKVRILFGRSVVFLYMNNQQLWDNWFIQPIVNEELIIIYGAGSIWL